MIEPTVLPRERGAATTGNPTQGEWVLEKTEPPP